MAAYYSMTWRYCGGLSHSPVTMHLSYSYLFIIVSNAAMKYLIKLCRTWASLVAQMIKNAPAMQESHVFSFFM